jgi:hypothetical protein
MIHTEQVYQTAANKLIRSVQPTEENKKKTPEDLQTVGKLRKLIDFCTKHRICTQCREVDGNHLYDGKSIGLVYKGEPLNYGDLLHEICHYFMACDSRKKAPNFGLGNSFITGSKDVENKVSDEFAYEEELLVCTLSLIYAKYWKMNAEVIASQISWLNGIRVEKVIQELMELEKRGLIEIDANHNLLPVKV